MKENREWFEQLEPGYRERALANLDALPNMDISSPSFLRALDTLSRSYLTKEGASFWGQVKNHYLDGSPLPPFPLTEFQLFKKQFLELKKEDQEEFKEWLKSEK